MKKNLVLALVLLLSACRRDGVRALDATPDVPGAIEFGLIPINQQKIIPLTIGNTGQISLQFQDLQVVEPFNVEVPPDPVAVGGSSDVLVKFEPTQPGDVTGTLTLMTSSIELPVITVQLHGTAFRPQLGLAPERLDFGDVNVGAQKTLTFQVTNHSPVPLNPTVLPLDPAGDYAVSPQGSLGKLTTDQGVTVSVSFAPSHSGSNDSSVVIDCPVCTAQQVLVTGNGIGGLPPIGADAGAPPDAGTPDAGSPDAGIPDAGTPDAGAPDAGTPAPDAGAPDAGTPVPDGGVAVADAGPAPLCVLSAQPGSADFGQLAPGQTARQVVTLRSSGSGSCFLQKPYLAAGSDPSFTAAPLSGGTLQPGDSTSFTVVFSPVVNTLQQVSGAVVIVSNDKASSPLEVPLTGESVAPPPPPPPPDPGHLVVEPLSLAFAAQVPGAPDAQTLTLLNDGGSNLSWKATTADGKIALSSSQGTLVPGGVSSLSVSVAAQAAAGARSSSIVIDAGVAGKVTVPVSITFTAAPPPPPAPAALVVAPLSLKFLAVAGKTPGAQSITVSNAGGQPLSWTGSVDDPEVSFTGTAGTLAGGAAQIVQVSVKSSAFAGKRTATLAIDAAAAGHANVVITIEFTQPPPPPPPPQYGGSAWPKWHHDNASSGLSHVDTSGTQGNLRWKAYVSPPVPCIEDGRTNLKKRCGTYVNSPVLAEDGSVIQLGGDGLLYEFDRSNGKKKWAVETAPPWIAANEGTPTVVKDGSIFLMTAGESFTRPQYYKISKGGQVLWHNTAGGTCGAKKCDGYDSSPALDDDGTLYEANDDVATIQAFDQSGTMIGEVALSPKSDLETQSAALAGGIGYWSGNGHLYALTPSKQLWSFTDPVAAKNDDWNPPAFFHNIKSSPALTADGKVIFTYVYETTKNGVVQQTTRVYAFAAGRTLKQLWMATLGPSTPKTGLPPGPGLASDYADSLHYRSGITSPAVGPDGTLYIGHCDGLFALDSKTGKFKWGAGMSEVVSSPAVGKDGTVYVGSMDGKLSAVSPQGTILWQQKTGGQLNSSPAIGADGTIYAMSDDGYLYAIH